MLDAQRLKDWPFTDIVERYDTTRTLLYALGVGCGRNSADLSHVYESGLRTLPTQALTLAGEGMWFSDPAAGIDPTQVVHAGQSLTLHRPLPASGVVVARPKVEAVYDKGPGRAALMVTARGLFDQVDGALLAESVSTVMILGHGGFGGDEAPAPSDWTLPARAPDHTCLLETRPEQAAVYRLSGDRNPLHIDPEAARLAGFPRPILHGLCTYGFASRALISALCDGDSEALAYMDGRFTGPVYPGETLAVDIWREADGTSARFRVRVKERDVVVLDQGCARHRTTMAA